MTVQTYLEKVSAMCARPLLSTREEKITFLRRLIAYWTRQLNMLAKGKPSEFTFDEINKIISTIQTQIKDLENAQT